MGRFFVLSLIIIFCFATEATGFPRSDSTSTYLRADLAFIFGGQIHNDNFLYNPGFVFQGSYGTMVNEYFGLGAGAGHQVFRNEKFIPLFVEAIGYKKPGRNAAFLKMQTGYSIGWYNGNTDTEGYDYKGGIFFDAGFGRKLPAGLRSSVMFHCSYRHQCAKINYTSPGSNEYDQRLNYDMILLSLSFQFMNK